MIDSGRHTKISVCMATYNGEKYISAQLKSILDQLGPKDEVIISDDNSSDNTLQIIKSFEDPRIKIFHSSFRNVILNFENALQKATGDFIFLSDQDDIWYEDKVSELLPLLNTYDMVFTNVCVFDSKKEECHPLYNQDKDYNGLFLNFIKNHCIGATMAFKAEVLRYALPIPKKVTMHDIWLFFITCIYGNTHYYKNPLIYYRKHEFNVTKTGEKTSNSLIKILSLRVNMFLTLTRRSIKLAVQR